MSNLKVDNGKKQSGLGLCLNTTQHSKRHSAPLRQAMAQGGGPGATCLAAVAQRVWRATPRWWRQ